MSRSGKLLSTESRNVRTSSGRSGSRSAPGLERFSEELYLPLPGPYGLDGVLPRALLAVLLYLPLVHRRVGRSHRPLQYEPQVGLVHVAVEDPGAGGLGAPSRLGCPLASFWGLPDRPAAHRRGAGPSRGCNRACPTRSCRGGGLPGPSFGRAPSG